MICNTYIHICYTWDIYKSYSIHYICIVLKQIWKTSFIEVARNLSHCVYVVGSYRMLQSYRVHHIGGDYVHQPKADHYSKANRYFVSQRTKSQWSFGQAVGNILRSQTQNCFEINCAIRDLHYIFLFSIETLVERR